MSLHRCLHHSIHFMHLLVSRLFSAPLLTALAQTPTDSPPRLFLNDYLAGISVLSHILASQVLVTYRHANTPPRSRSSGKCEIRRPVRPPSAPSSHHLLCILFYERSSSVAASTQPSTFSPPPPPPPPSLSSLPYLLLLHFTQLQLGIGCCEARRAHRGHRTAGQKHDA